jgi:hypothetical protein
MIYVQPTPAIAPLTPQRSCKPAYAGPIIRVATQAKCLCWKASILPYSVKAGTNFMTKQQQRMEELERQNARLKNELLSANEQIAQLKILKESYTMQIRQLKEQKNLNRC